MNPPKLSKLETLFNMVRDGAFCARINNPKMDGRAFWQYIKNQCNNVHFPTNSKWRFKAYIPINETNELQHFIAQHFNIPHNTPHPTLTKILQIALNSGQFLAIAPVYEVAGYDYFINDLHLLQTYVHNDDIIAVSDFIPESLITSIETYIKSYK